jgi:PhnB protein
MAIIQPLLSIRDVTASIAFYTQHLGFTLEGTPLPGDDGKPVFAGVRHGTTVLWLDHTDYGELPPNTPVGVGVELYVSLADETDIDALYVRLKECGVKIVQELKEQFWGDKRFVIEDPDGYRLSLAKNVRAVSHEEQASHTRQS